MDFHEVIELIECNAVNQIHAIPPHFRFAALKYPSKHNLTVQNLSSRYTHLLVLQSHGVRIVIIPQHIGRSYVCERMLVCSSAQQRITDLERE